MYIFIAKSTHILVIISLYHGIPGSEGVPFFLRDNKNVLNDCLHNIFIVFH